MVQVIVDGRNLEPVRQFEDLFDVVEPVVVLEDQPILTVSGRRRKFCSKRSIASFIPIDAPDMQDDFIGRIGAECRQDFVVVNQIGDGALPDVFRR